VPKKKVEWCKEILQFSPQSVKPLLKLEREQQNTVICYRKHQRRQVPFLQVIYSVGEQHRSGLRFRPFALLHQWDFLVVGVLLDHGFQQPEQAINGRSIAMRIKCAVFIVEPHCRITTGVVATFQPCQMVKDVAYQVKIDFSATDLIINVIFGDVIEGPGTDDVGGVEQLRMWDVAWLIRDLIKKKFDKVITISPTKEIEDDIKSRMPDISRAKEIYGWKPNISIEDGINKVIDYWSNRL